MSPYPKKLPDLRERECAGVRPSLPTIQGAGSREELILGNLSLVRHILGRLTAKLPPRIDLDNLEAAGMLGLVEAANRFEPERGVSFKTFAYTRIRGAIYDELRRNSPFSQELLERITLVRKAMQGLQPPVHIETLAQKTGLAEDDVNECLAAMHWPELYPGMTSMNRARTLIPVPANVPSIASNVRNEGSCWLKPSPPCRKANV